MMVRALLINGPGSLQMLKPFAAKLRQAAARILISRIMIPRINARRPCLTLTAG
jgi:hypothetical protein